MELHNLRLGFATNSSSSHSMVIIPQNKDIPQTDMSDIDDHFGWSNFRLADRESKLSYIMATLYENIHNLVGTEISKAIVKGLGFEGELKKIDHQSQYTLPNQFGKNIIDIEFFNEFKDRILDERIVILGGNDNTEDCYPFSEVSYNTLEMNLPKDSLANIHCRKDNDHWILYDRNNGNRVIFSYKKEAVFNPVAPLLIDVKITDFCDIGCAFCYQGSTKNGKHAENIMNLPYQLKQAKIFEVALGGGCPTTHPHFVEFVETCNQLGIVVNFTTKSFKWIKSSIRERIINNIGAFAFSIDKSFELTTLLQLVEKYNIPSNKVNLQIIPAILELSFIDEIFATIKKFNSNRTGTIRITLLGYKDTGRGKKYIKIAKEYYPENETKWIELFKNNYYHKVSIDTTLAKRCEVELKANGIPNWLYHIEEGKYSMYIDMVKKEYGASSYHKETFKSYQYIDIEKMFESIEPI